MVCKTLRSWYIYGQLKFEISLYSKMQAWDSPLSSRGLNFNPYRQQLYDGLDYSSAANDLWDHLKKDFCEKSLEVVSNI